MNAPPSRVSVVIPNWNGREWLPACLESLARQTIRPAQVIIVDNGSQDGSLEYLRAEHPEVMLVDVGHNSGFAHAANRGLAGADGEFVALVNPDVVLAVDWLARMSGALLDHPRAASVACKMLLLDDSRVVYDAGDILRRDGVCEQRGRFGRDGGQLDEPGDVFGACAGAALYRARALASVGGFDERYFAYLEDVDLALRLRLAGWVCRYEPAVARHASEGSSRKLPGAREFLVTRNTLLLVAKTFPLRWLPYVAYRQLAWAWHAALDRRLAGHLRALGAAVPMVRAVVRERRGLRRRSRVAIEVAVPPRPFRATGGGGPPAGLV